MAEVTGTIGNEPVELNNAATEATLRMLLQASLATTKEQKENIKRLAQKSGLDPAAVAAANQGLVQTNVASSKLKIGLSLASQSAKFVEKAFRQTFDLTEKLASGSGNASDVFSAFSKLPLGIGLVATVFQKLALVQESYLKTYQTITSAGINFSGSLTDMRLAAASTYLTLDQYSNLIKNNSEMFARMGGSVNDGIISFTKFSNSFLNSDLGRTVTAMGYSFESANEHLASYIGLIGVNDRKDLETSSSLRQGAAAYLDQLDRLADITGKTREQQEASLKKTMMAADVQVTAARMDTESRKAFLANVQYMNSIAGDAGVEMALAQAQGRSIRTKEASMLTAIAPDAKKAADELAYAAKTYGLGSKEYIEAQNRVRVGLQTGMDRIPTTIFSANEAFKGISDASITYSRDLVNGQTSLNKMTETEQQRQARLKDITNSEADSAIQLQKTLKDLSTEILTAVQPLFPQLQQVMTSVIKSLAEGVRWILEHKDSIVQVVKGLWDLKGSVAAVIVAMLAYKAHLALEKSKEIKDNLLKGTSSLPLHVIVTNPILRVHEVGRELFDRNRRIERAGRRTGGAAGRAGAEAASRAGGAAAGRAAASAATRAGIGAAGAVAGGIVSSMLGALSVGLLAYSITDTLDEITGRAVTGWISKQFTSDSEKQANAMLSGKKASGGIVNPGSYLVGEKGPEILNVGANGDIISNDNINKLLKNISANDQLNKNNAIAIETLNSTLNKMLQYLSTTADNTKHLKDMPRDLYLRP